MMKCESIYSKQKGVFKVKVKKFLLFYCTFVCYDV